MWQELLFLFFLFNGFQRGHSLCKNNGTSSGEGLFCIIKVWITTSKSELEKEHNRTETGKPKF